MRGETSIAELCRKEGISQNLYYRWSKDFMESGRKRLDGDTMREANTTEVQDLQRSSFESRLKASQTLQLQLTSTVTLYQALGGGWVPAQDSIQLSY